MYFLKNLTKQRSGLSTIAKCLITSGEVFLPFKPPGIFLEISSVYTCRRYSISLSFQRVEFGKESASIACAL